MVKKKLRHECCFLEFVLTAISDEQLNPIKKRVAKVKTVNTQSFAVEVTDTFTFPRGPTI